MSNIAQKITAAFMLAAVVDGCGSGGEYGAKLLRSNSFTYPAAPYYEGFGAVMHFGWESLRELASGINDIAQRHNHP